jgi:serine/threonine protein phosphatase PrpC
VKISWAMLQDVLVGRCGVDAERLHSFEGNLGDLFRGSAPSLDALSCGLGELAPEIDWSWVHRRLPLEDLTAHFEVALAARAEGAAAAQLGAHERRFSARHPDAHEQSTMWSGGNSFVMLAGSGGQSTGNFASSLGLLALLALLRANATTTASLEERLSRRAQAIDTGLRADNALTGRDQSASVALLEVTKDQVGIAHCGSILVCRARGGVLYPVSADHTLGAEMRRNGHVPMDSWQASMVVRGLGVNKPTPADVHILPRTAEDRFWLVSKRLVDTLASLEELRAWLGPSHDPAPLFARLTSDTRKRFPDHRWTLSMLEVMV